MLSSPLLQAYAIVVHHTLERKKKKMRPRSPQPTHWMEYLEGLYSFVYMFTKYLNLHPGASKTFAEIPVKTGLSKQGILRNSVFPSVPG